MRQFPVIDWVNPGTLGLALRREFDTATLYDALEQVSERNISGRPVRYLFDFLETGMQVTPDDALDLASFFVELTPSKTAIAIASPDPANPDVGELIFRSALKGGGFLVSVFSSRDAATEWLSNFVTSCEEKQLQCGPECEFALSAACPAIPHVADVLGQLNR